MKNLMVIEYVVNEDYMLGAFLVKSEETGETFYLDPRSQINVLYFDSDLFSWMIDVADNLTWDNEEEEWKS